MASEVAFFNEVRQRRLRDSGWLQVNHHGERISETGRRMMAPSQSVEGVRHRELIDRTDDPSVFTPLRSGFPKCGSKLRPVKLRASPGKARPTRSSPASPA